MDARSCAAAAFVVMCMLHARDARADVSSWLSAGGGVSMQRDDVSKHTSTVGAMSFAVGVGSSPMRSFVVGGLFRTTTNFTLGTDLNLSARFATGGFARGGWGFALDLGPTLRLWKGGDYGQLPAHGMIFLGMPWGLQAGVGGDVWSFTGAPYAQGLTALLEIDLLRLTVMRRGTTTSWWPNPSPAGGATE